MTEQEEINRYNEWRNSFQGFKVKRFDIINYLIEQNNYVNYLEIGVCDGDNFGNIKVKHKDAVDPNPIGKGIEYTNYKITSDEFFNFINDYDDIKYDIIFIDGLHHWEQVEKDLVNSLNHLESDGIIVMHDCNPMFEVTQRRYAVVGAWNGDTWKAFAKFRMTSDDLEMCVVDTDHGVGIVKKGTQELYPLSELEYPLLNDNRKELLNLITTDEFFKKYERQIDD